MLLERINPAYGFAPSRPPVKLYRFVKPVPSVLIAKMVPLFEAPLPVVVPYRTLPDRSRVPAGPPPSLPPVKVYKVLKSEPSILMANTVPVAQFPPAVVVP